jgi:hypothetical protein
VPRYVARPTDSHTAYPSSQPPAPNTARAQQQLRELVRDLVAGAAAAGQVRDDVAADELATFCLNALAAATSLPSKAAVRRLVQVTLAGLRPNAPSDAQDGR